MMDLTTQIGAAANVFDLQRADPARINGIDEPVEERLAERLQDRYSSAGKEDAFNGIYSRESLLKNQEASGESADEDGLGSRFVESEKGQLQGPNDLDDGDKELVQRLRARDIEVRMHEQSHATAAGKYAAGPPSYNYQRGPDGKMYAIGGSLAVDVGQEASAAENNSKSAILRAAAMGVAEPSAADAMVAAQASHLMGQGLNLQA